MELAFGVVLGFILAVTYTELRVVSRVSYLAQHFLFMQLARMRPIDGKQPHA